MNNPYQNPSDRLINDPALLRPFALWRLEELLDVEGQTEYCNVISAREAIERAWKAKCKCEPDFELEDLPQYELQQALYIFVFRQFDVDIRAFESKDIELTPKQYLEMFQDNEWFREEGEAAAAKSLLQTHLGAIGRATLENNPMSLLTLCKTALQDVRVYRFDWLLDEHAHDLSQELCGRFREKIIDCVTSASTRHAAT